MPEVKYGNRTIEYRFKLKEGLKSHYISVQKKDGVVLKGEPIPQEKADAMVLKKARWILDKLQLVEAIGEEDIVTGARIQYLGRRYYVQLFENNELDHIQIEFNESKFKVSTPKSKNNQEELQAAFQSFFKDKAKEKIQPRVEKWSKKTGLHYNDLKFRKLDKRWGSCTPSNNIIINTDAVKLPFSLIDYLIVHELTHTAVKSHSKEFWAELSKHMSDWKERDAKMAGMKM